MVNPQVFAIVPAAGRSRRMGSPKLLLPWGEATVIEQVLAAWQSAGVARRVVVTHRDDIQLAQLARAAGAEVVTPAVPPPDMKASVRAAIGYLAQQYQPAADDLWLLAPADMPRLSPGVIQGLLAAAPQNPHAILVPTYDGRRGHPVLFRWSMSSDIDALAENEGVNELLNRYPVIEIPVPDDAILADLDTPDDYRNARPA